MVDILQQWDALALHPPKCRDELLAQAVLAAGTGTGTVTGPGHKESWAKLLARVIAGINHFNRRNQCRKVYFEALLVMFKDANRELYMEIFLRSNAGVEAVTGALCVTNVRTCDHYVDCLAALALISKFYPDGRYILFCHGVTDAVAALCHRVIDNRVYDAAVVLLVDLAVDARLCDYQPYTATDHVSMKGTSNSILTRSFEGVTSQPLSSSNTAAKLSFASTQPEQYSGTGTALSTSDHAAIAKTAKLVQQSANLGNPNHSSSIFLNPSDPTDNSNNNLSIQGVVLSLLRSTYIETKSLAIKLCLMVATEPKVKQNILPTIPETHPDDVQEGPSSNSGSNGSWLELAHSQISRVLFTYSNHVDTRYFSAELIAVFYGLYNTSSALIDVLGSFLCLSSTVDGERMVGGALWRMQESLELRETVPTLEDLKNPPHQRPLHSAGNNPSINNNATKGGSNKDTGSFEGDYESKLCSLVAICCFAVRRVIEIQVRLLEPRSIRRVYNRAALSHQTYNHNNNYNDSDDDGSFYGGILKRATGVTAVLATTTSALEQQLGVMRASGVHLALLLLCFTHTQHLRVFGLLTHRRRDSIGRDTLDDDFDEGNHHGDDSVTSSMQAAQPVGLKPSNRYTRVAPIKGIHADNNTGTSERSVGSTWALTEGSAGPAGEGDDLDGNSSHQPGDLTQLMLYYLDRSIPGTGSHHNDSKEVEQEEQEEQEQELEKQANEQMQFETTVERPPKIVITYHLKILFEAISVLQLWCSVDSQALTDVRRAFGDVGLTTIDTVNRLNIDMVETLQWVFVTSQKQKQQQLYGRSNSNDSNNSSNIGSNNSTNNSLQLQPQLKMMTNNVRKALNIVDRTLALRRMLDRTLAEDKFHESDSNSNGGRHSIKPVSFATEAEIEARRRVLEDFDRYERERLALAPKKKKKLKDSDLTGNGARPHHASADDQFEQLNDSLLEMYQSKKEKYSHMLAMTLDVFQRQREPTPAHHHLLDLGQDDVSLASDATSPVKKGSGHKMKGMSKAAAAAAEADARLKAKVEADKKARKLARLLKSVEAMADGKVDNSNNNNHNSNSNSNSNSSPTNTGKRSENSPTHSLQRGEREQERNQFNGFGDEGARNRNGGGQQSPQRPMKLFQVKKPPNFQLKLHPKNAHRLLSLSGMSSSLATIDEPSTFFDPLNDALVSPAGGVARHSRRAKTIVMSNGMVCHYKGFRSNSPVHPTVDTASPRLLSPPMIHDMEASMSDGD